MLGRDVVISKQCPSLVLAKHSKHFSLEDSLSVGVDRMQRNFEPMRRQVETWRAQQLSTAVAKLTSTARSLKGTLISRGTWRGRFTNCTSPQHDEFESRTSGVCRTHSRRRLRNLIPFHSSGRQRGSAAFSKRRVRRVNRGPPNPAWLAGTGLHPNTRSHNAIAARTWTHPRLCSPVEGDLAPAAIPNKAAATSGCRRHAQSDGKHYGVIRPKSELHISTMRATIPSRRSLAARALAIQEWAAIWHRTTASSRRPATFPPGSEAHRR